MHDKELQTQDTYQNKTRDKTEPHQRTGYNVTDSRNVVFIVKQSVARGIQMYLSVSFTEPKAL